MYYLKRELMSYLLLPGIRIHYVTLGRGSPLLMLHGGPGMNYRYMLALKELAKDFRLVLLDQRGSGRSFLSDLNTLTFANCVSDLECLREHLGIDRWALVGHSFGGFVALEYAIRFPTRVTHLVLLDTGCSAKSVREMASSQLLRMGYSHGLASAAHRFFNGSISRYQAPFVFLRFSRAYYYKLRLLPLLRSITGIHRLKTAWYWFRYLFQTWDIEAQLGSIEAPSLIIAGRYDFQFPEGLQLNMSTKIPKSELIIIEQAGHNTPMECPEQLTSHIRKFIGANSGKASTA
jgi:proline iminopeptidase